MKKKNGRKRRELVRPKGHVVCNSNGNAGLEAAFSFSSAVSPPLPSLRFSTISASKLIENLEFLEQPGKSLSIFTCFVSC